MTDIVDGLRELIAEAKIPGMYTPDERQQFSSYWIGVLTPDRLAALLDEIESSRAALQLANSNVAEATHQLNEAEAEIERLRHPKIIVGSRKLWEAMGSEVAMDEATLAAITAYDNCTRLPEDVMGYGPMRAALTAALPHLKGGE